MVAGGLGGLNIPKKVHFPGDDTFKGRIIHTAEWDTSFNTENRRVAVIGTGPSAVQTVPAIAPEVKWLILIYYQTSSSLGPFPLYCFTHFCTPSLRMSCIDRPLVPESHDACAFHYLYDY